MALRFRRLRVMVAAVLLFVVVTAASTAVHAQTRLSLGTGGTGGVYYPLGGGMAEIINTHVPGVMMTAEVTGASLENSRRVGTGDMDLGIANADALYFAYMGMPPFLEGAYPNLRAVASLYPSTMQIAVLADSGIHTIADLRSKRASVGPPGGATRVMSENIFAEYGILGSVTEVDLSFNESVDAMKDGNLEAVFVLAGVPAAAVIDLTTSHDARFLAIEPERVDSLLAKFPYYTAERIPAGTYRGQTEEITTIGIQNVLFARADLSEDLVYRITKAIFENLDYLVSIHQIASLISVETAPQVPIPLHPGAERYYREVGVLE